jgi:hypothetical protein
MGTEEACRLVAFLRRDLFTVQLDDGITITAVMPATSAMLAQGPKPQGRRAVFPHLFPMWKNDLTS